MNWMLLLKPKCTLACVSSQTLPHISTLEKRVLDRKNRFNSAGASQLDHLGRESVYHVHKFGTKDSKDSGLQHIGTLMTDDVLHIHATFQP